LSSDFHAIGNINTGQTNVIEFTGLDRAGGLLHVLDSLF
jgi:hypothetical protein